MSALERFEPFGPDAPLFDQVADMRAKQQAQLGQELQQAFNDKFTEVFGPAPTFEDKTLYETEEELDRRDLDCAARDHVAEMTKKYGAEVKEESVSVTHFLSWQIELREAFLDNVADISRAGIRMDLSRKDSRGKPITGPRQPASDQTTTTKEGEQ